MVSDTTFEEKLQELEEWAKSHSGLPEKIGESRRLKMAQVVLLRLTLHNVTSR